VSVRERERAWLRRKGSLACQCGGKKRRKYAISPGGKAGGKPIPPEGGGEGEGERLSANSRGMFPVCALSRRGRGGRGGPSNLPPERKSQRRRSFLNEKRPF